MLILGKNKGGYLEGGGTLVEKAAHAGSRVLSTWEGARVSGAHTTPTGGLISKCRRGPSPRGSGVLSLPSLELLAYATAPGGWMVPHSPGE